MIIKLTTAEVKTYIAAKLNLNPLGFELEIVRPDEQLLAAFRRTVELFPGCRTFDKIPAIKKFRELAPKDKDDLYPCVGLADAKWAVENPTVALSNLEETGRIRG